MKTLTFIICTFFSLVSIAQTVKFKDNRWFDHAKPNYFRNPISAVSMVTISKDKITVQLGQKLLEYKIIASKEFPKERKTIYNVNMEGVESTIDIHKGKEYFQRERRAVAWIVGSDWTMIVPLRNIDPPGYLFAGEEKIDVNAADAQIMGYYKFKYLLTKSRQEISEINRKGMFDSYFVNASDCAKDIQVEFRSDHTLTWFSGQKVPGCKQDERIATWKLNEVVVDGVRILQLTIGKGMDAEQFQVVDLEKGRVGLRGEFNLGGDSTTEAVLDLERTKKK